MLFIYRSLYRAHQSVQGLRLRKLASGSCCAFVWSPFPWLEAACVQGLGLATLLALMPAQPCFASQELCCFMSNYFERRPPSSPLAESKHYSTSDIRLTKNLLADGAPSSGGNVKEEK